MSVYFTSYFKVLAGLILCISDPKIKCQMNGHEPMTSQTSWKICRVEKESMNRDYKQPQAADGPARIPEQHPPDTAEEGLVLHIARW